MSKPKQKADAKVGRIGEIRLGAMCIGVRILEAQSRYGRVDLHVEPLNGSGSAWVNEGKVALRPKAATFDGRTQEHPFEPAEDDPRFCVNCGCTETFVKHTPQPAIQEQTPSAASAMLLLPPLPDGEVET